MLASDVALAKGADPCPWWGHAVATAREQGRLGRLEKRRAGPGRLSDSREQSDGTRR